MEQLELRNYTEDIVKRKMSDVLRTMQDVCQCERCKMDMLAHALNNSPPRYVVTARGELYAKLSVLQGQLEVDVVRAITDAAMLVSKFPRHGKEGG